MEQLKKNAAAWLLAMFCAVFMVPVIFTACTNGIDKPEFKASIKKERVPIEKPDTVWIKDTINVEIIKKEGIKANGNPDLSYQSEVSYKTIYPLIEDGEPVETETMLNVWVKLLKSDDNIIEVTDSIIGNPSSKIGEKSTKQRQEGDYTKLAFDANWVYSWGKFTETVNTMHDMAWYKGWQMLSYYWTGHFKEVRYGIGEAYVHNNVDGKLFADTLVWEYFYGQDDVRILKKVRKFFLPNTVIEPDPEAKEIFGENFTFKTTSDSTAITSFEVWQRLNNGKTNMISNLSAGLKFWLVNAKGEVIDLSKDQEFLLNDLQAVAGSKQKVGEPRIVGSISIQEYVTTYTTKTDKSSSIFYGHTEEATLLIPEKLGGNIPFTAKDFVFADKGTSKLQDIADEGSFERMQAFTRIVAVYHDRSLNGQASIILRKVTDTPAPEKKLTGYEERSWDGKDSYVIRHFYDDNTYEDITIEDPRGCTGTLTMANGSKIYRDNTNFGTPTIAENGKASTKGEATASGKVTRQQMTQPMKSSFDGYAHNFEYEYTGRSYSAGGLAPIELSVPTWLTKHVENKLGTVRNEVENEKNYEVTPINLMYSAAYGKNETSPYSHSFEVWKFVSEVLKVTAIMGKDFGFDYVDARTSKTYFTAYNVMSDNSTVDLGTEEFFLNNWVENSARQIINPADNFDVETATAVPGTKIYQSERTVNGKWGKAIIKLYKTTLTTKTNKASTNFFMYHEEATYFPNKGKEFALDSKEYTTNDGGISALEELGRKDGKDGKLYKSLVDFTFNERAIQMFNEVELWVKTNNKYDIDTDWTSANAGAVRFWDPSNTARISFTAIYNGKDNKGGIKGFSDGIEVIKATWDTVNQPSGRTSVAQDAGGKWYICQVSETTDKKGWIWRSIMKDSEGQAIRSIQKTQLQVYGTTEVYINTSVVENADGTVTMTAPGAGSVTLSWW